MGLNLVIEQLEIITVIFDRFYQLIMAFILIVANRIGLTDFEHISIDGTIKRAHNSAFNSN